MIAQVLVRVRHQFRAPSQIYGDLNLDPSRKRTGPLDRNYRKITDLGYYVINCATQHTITSAITSRDVMSEMVSFGLFIVELFELPIFTISST